MRPRDRTISSSGTTLTELVLSLAIFIVLVSLGALACSERLAKSRLKLASILIESAYQTARRRAIDRGEWIYLAVASKNDVPDNGLYLRSFSFPDGRRGIEPSNPTESWERALTQQKDLHPIAPTLHLAELRLLATAIPPDFGPMARPPVHRYYRLGHSECHSVTPIPIRDVSGATAQGETSKVIEISPLGACRILRDSNAFGTVSVMELAFTYAPFPADPQTQPDDPGPERYAAIQISATTGYSRNFTP
jgi:hypothetical protein